MNDMALLSPGLDAAGIELQIHDAAYRSPYAGRAMSDPEAVSDLIEQILPVPPRFDSVAVTGLVEYSICPKRFAYQFVDGHPGVGEGASANARMIGTLAHAALELGKRTLEDMSPHSDGASAEILAEALQLARGFDEGPEFKSFQLGSFQREVPVSLEINGTTVIGKADLVGDDFVLDFKTDGEMLPDDHAIQLWAYSSALNKPRALIAYLRQKKLYEYKPLELAVAEQEASAAAEGIQKGNFATRPSDQACRRCRFSILCNDCIDQSDKK
jgi:ATP-dependent helicase/nuclease subunit A